MMRVAAEIVLPPCRASPIFSTPWSNSSNLRLGPYEKHHLLASRTPMVFATCRHRAGRASFASFQAAMSAKRISQSTFDETVKENMEEFDMCREEATKDAIKQFTTQGVDLANICISYDACDDHWLEEVDAQLAVIRTALGDGKAETISAFEIEPVMTALVALRGFCKDPKPERVANAKKMMAAQNGVNLVTNLLQRDTRELVLEAMRTAEAMVNDDEANRDSFWVMSMAKLSQTACTYQDDREVLKQVMDTVRALAVKTESNKVYFVNYGGLDLLIYALENYREDPEVVCSTCLAFKVVTAVDDLRKDFSAAHNHTRALVTKGAVPLLISVAKSYSTKLEIMGAAIGSLKNLAINEDSVNQIVANGGVDLTVAALQNHLDNLGLARTACSLLRNVSADDHHKTVLCTGEGARLLLKAMRTHTGDSRLQEVGLATIAAMSLRSPDNTARMVGSGTIAITMQAMRMHRTVGTLQRQGCLAVRNMVARNPEFVEAFLDAGAEQVLREAGKSQESVDEAYSALRDLKCEVKRLVVDRETGNVRDAVEEFGKVSSKFNPVFEASNELEDNMEQAITEPSQAYRF